MMTHTGPMTDFKVSEFFYLVPLKTADGARAIDDDRLRMAYRRMADIDRADIVFYDSAITEDDFIRLMSLKDYFHVYDGKGRSGKLMGFFWLDGFTGRSAYIHFCSLIDNGSESLMIAGSILEKLLSGRDSEGRRCFLSIRGRVPEFNRVARRFMRILGFRELGVVPKAAYSLRTGGKVDLVEGYITMEMLKKRPYV